MGSARKQVDPPDGSVFEIERAGIGCAHVLAHLVPRPRLGVRDLETDLWVVMHSLHGFAVKDGKRGAQYGMAGRKSPAGPLQGRDIYRSADTRRQGIVKGRTLRCTLRQKPEVFLIMG